MKRKHKVRFFGIPFQLWGPHSKADTLGLCRKDRKADWKPHVVVVLRRTPRSRP